MDKISEIILNLKIILLAMIINNIGPRPLNNISSKKKARAKGSFSILQDVPDETSDSVAESDPIHNLNPFLSLQEYYPPEDQEREDLNKASKEILNALNKIRIKILSENLQLQDLQNLKRIIDSQSMTFKTQEVQELYAQVRVKAEVELAKYGQKLNLMDIA